MSLLLPPRDGSKWSKNHTLPLVQSVPNPYQGRTIVMTSETSKKLFFFFLFPQKGWHGTGAATRRTDFDILIVRTGAAGSSMRVIMRLLMNRRRNKRGQMAHTLTNTLARTLTQMQRLARAHSRLKGHRIQCAYKRKIFEGDVLPVAKERARKETPLHTMLHQS